MWTYIHTDELYHHGVKGMKWGVRRYQNADGSLTEEGKKRFSRSIKRTSRTWYGGPRRMVKIEDDIKYDLEREPSFKKTAKRLLQLNDRSIKLKNDAYEIQDPKKQREAFREAGKAYNDYQREVGKVVDSLLGRYGDQKITAYYGGKTVVIKGKDLVATAIKRMNGWVNA